MSAAADDRGYFWRAPSVARLIGQARAGDSWAAIGCEFYPRSRNRRRAARAAAEIFRRHASPDDRTTRAAALRADNWHRPPGLSRRAEGRRRRRGIDDRAVIRERADPLQGLGSCFA